MNSIAVAKQGWPMERAKGEGYLTTVKSCGISRVESKLMLNQERPTSSQIQQGFFLRSTTVQCPRR